jgi:tetratricopeptide (TPR) repeat protein
MSALGKFEKLGSCGPKWRVCLCVFSCLLLRIPLAHAQSARPPLTGFPQEAAPRQLQVPPDARSELQVGTSLTRQGLFQQAVPHLLAAQGGGSDRYATAVNLAICYVGLTRYKEAIAALKDIDSSGFQTAVVENLLTQAYLGDGQLRPAWAAFEAAAKLTPQDEKLYAFVADASTDHHDYEMGLQVVEAGIRQLPGSARLHYERGLFLARLDRMEEAKPEFDQAVKLAPGDYIASLAKVQRLMYDDDYSAATALLRDLIHAGHRDYQTLSLLGTVLLNTGAAPGEPDFLESQSVLEESANQHPNYSATQLALGKIYEMRSNFDEARDHLEFARRLEPANPAVYSHLAHVYRKLGDPEKAHSMEQELARLLRERKTPPSVVEP